VARKKHFEALQTRRATRVETPRTDVPKVAVLGEGRPVYRAFPDGRGFWLPAKAEAKDTI
jgi:hypothetical protein